MRTGRSKAPSADFDAFDDTGYSDADATRTVSRSDDYYDDSQDEGRRPFGWNGGTDLGLLVLRLALGAVFLVHGAQKLFGVLGGPGTDGFAQKLTTMGFEQTATLALVTGAAEVGGGALLVLGLFTPVGAAAVAGVMGVAIALHLRNGPFVEQDGYEYEAMLAAAAVALMFTGPGRVALDNGRAWFRHPVVSGFLCLLISAGSAAGVFFLLR